MASLDEIMANATPVERVVSICVAGQLAGDYERLTAQLQQASMDEIQERLSGDAQSIKIRKELDSLEELMAEYTYDFRFRAMSPKRWSDLLAKHPDPEKYRLFDPDTFPGAAIQASCVDPDGLDDDEKFDALMDKLSTAQQSELFDGAWEANTTAPKGRTSYNAYVTPPGSETS